MGMLLHRHSVDANATTAQSLGVEPEPVVEEVKPVETAEKKKPGRKPKAE